MLQPTTDRRKSYLLIIGNGFDLSHGIKTDYISFIKDLVNKQISNPDLVPCLFKTQPTFRSYEVLLDLIENNAPGVKTSFSNEFLLNLLTKISLENWCDIENEYFQQIFNTVTPKIINNDFKIIQNYLEQYLFDQFENPLDKRIGTYLKLFKTLKLENTIILNFNYTKTLDLYKEETNKIPTIHIHGEINNKTNPIIFGFAANHEESRELIDKNDEEYMRFIKKHCYKRTNNINKLNDFLFHQNEIHVLILGHSCGISDKLILNTILNHKNVKNTRVFYHNQYENYFRTQVNMDRIMNNDINFSKLINFQDSHRMPQLNDNEDKQRQFNQYLKYIFNSEV